MNRILHGNLLIGTIPKEIGMLKSLKVLDLGSNQLTGPIPSEIGNLSSIVKMLVENECWCESDLANFRSAAVTFPFHSCHRIFPVLQ